MHACPGSGTRAGQGHEGSAAFKPHLENLSAVRGVISDGWYSSEKGVPHATYTRPAMQSALCKL